MRTDISNRKLKRLFSIIWVLVIFIGTTFPNSDITVGANVLVPHVDKIAHFTMYFILQLLLMWQFDEIKTGRFQIRILLLVCAYGILLELIQKYFLVDRFFESYDIIANITGAFMGIILFHRIKT